MTKRFLFILVLLIPIAVFCQNGTIKGFEYHPRTNVTGFTQTQIDTFISKCNLEIYRLRDGRTTLEFDNGFDIVLLSANELAHLGLIPDGSSYPAAYPAHYQIPVFHLTPQGWVMAAYSSVNGAKYKGR
jgi:hypothetical protein